MDQSNSQTRRYQPRFPQFQYEQRHEQAHPKYRPRVSSQGSMGPPASIPVDPLLVSWHHPNSSALFPSQFPSARNSQIGSTLQERYSLPDPSGELDPVPRDILERRTGQVDSDPLVRFWRDDGPWNAQGVGVGSAVGFINQPPVVPSYAASHERSDRSQAPPGRYRGPTKTGIDPDHSGRLTSDEGYGTQSRITASVLSADYPDQSQESQSFAGDTDGGQIQNDAVSRGYLHGASQETQSVSCDGCSNDSRDPNTVVSLACEHLNCGFVSKNQSDSRKHRQRHDRPFVCEESDCLRRQGFSTKNDLDRHKKSVHKIAPSNTIDKSFQCKGRNCTKKDKVWPRLDNFRAHGKRVHKDEDLDELVRKSMIDSAILPYGNDIGYGQHFDSDIMRQNHSLMAAMDAHGTNLQTIERSPGHQVDHTVQRSPGDSLLQSIDVYAGTQLPAVDRYDRVELAHDSRLCPDDARPSIGTRNSGRINSNSRLSADAITRETTLSRTTSERDYFPRNSKNNEFLGENRKSMPAAKSRPQIVGSAAPEERVKQLSKAIASEVTKNINQVSTEELELIIQTQVLNLLGSNGSSKRTSDDAGLDNSIESIGKRVTCSLCPKMMDRPCDIKKHEKRHHRPYGCTYATCTKAFGSKNDWKRHENSQHHQLETWRCHEENPQSKINQCAKVFYRRDPFQAHLRKDHGVKDEDYIRGECKRVRIGRNGQSGFWCGFCKLIVKLEKRGLEAWDERFNHIDNMHFKKGQRIEAWYPLDKDIPKGLLKNGNVLDSGGHSMNMDDESEDDDSDGEAWSRRHDVRYRDVNTESSRQVLRDYTIPVGRSEPTEIHPQVCPSVRSEPTHHVQEAHSLERSHSSKKQKTDQNWRWHWAWTCCQCNMYHDNLDITPSCWGESCNDHRPCTHCGREQMFERPAE